MHSPAAAESLPLMREVAKIVSKTIFDGGREKIRFVSPPTAFGGAPSSEGAFFCKYGEAVSLPHIRYITLR